MKEKYQLDEGFEPVKVVEDNEKNYAEILIVNDIENSSKIITKFLGTAVRPPRHDEKRVGLGPLFFETVLKLGSGKELKLERYRSYSEAIKGHKNHVLKRKVITSDD